MTETITTSKKKLASLIAVTASTLIVNHANSMTAGQMVDELSFEDMLAMDVSIKTATKNEEKLLDSPAAVFVISAEDIQQYGVTTIPDALRMAPGVHVGRLSTSEWAVTIRGFNGRYARYLQVLVDGRSIYDPVFSGVNWDEHGLAIEDIQRIEVVRGPGGIAWGPNAVNGVINIVRKKSSQQQGLTVSGEVGDERRHTARVNYGFALNDDTYVNAYVKSTELKGLQGESGLREDDWQTLIAGAALEYRTERDNISINTKFSDNQNSFIGSFFDLQTPSKTNRNIQSDNQMFDIQMDWQRSFSENQRLNWRLAYSSSSRFSDQYDIDNNETAFDIEYTHQLYNRHQLTYGLNFLRIDSSFETAPSFGLTITPAENSFDNSSLFIQDAISIGDELKVLIGARHDNFSDCASTNQFTGRAIWSPNDSARLWLSASQAETVPSRINIDSSQILVSAVDLNTPFFPADRQAFIYAIVNDAGIEGTSSLMAYELGGRYLVNSNFSLDATFYLHRYDDLLGSSPTGNGAVSLVPNRSAKSSGIEVSMNWRLSENWMLQYSGSYVIENNRQNDGFGASIDQQLLDLVPAFETVMNDIEQARIADNDSDNLHSIRLSGDLSDNLQLGIWWRYVAEIENTVIDDYSTLDMNLNYQMTPNLTVGFAIRNLFANDQIEYGRTILGSELFDIPTSYTLNFTWRG